MAAGGRHRLSAGDLGTLLTTDLRKTIQVGLRRFIQAYSADYNLIMAASLCSLLPVTVVFLFLQRYFIEGIATTGMKG